jgi:exodeoxyribonuclease VII large subunit
LLAGVAATIAQAFKGGVWTTVEVMRADIKGGHVYLELAERDSTGGLIAKAQAMIWRDVAARILPNFERATGATIGPGIKLLLRAKPMFKAQFGFSLEINAIDPDYTLGDLEARKREIRARLQRDGIIGRNRQLPPPWDFSAVLVVAPQAGAGLGDFQKEADRLEHHGICAFVYAFSRFQGEGAAGEVLQALQEGLLAWTRNRADVPDAIVIIRGGGAVNDLAWLNDYALARFLCEADSPVLTGIGHERDSTVLDEIAHHSFDTPSKVIAGIESRIARRAEHARSAFMAITAASERLNERRRASVEQLHQAVKGDARATLSKARGAATEAVSSIKHAALQTVYAAKARSRQQLAEVKQGTDRQLARARTNVPERMAEIRAEALGALTRARSVSTANLAAVTDRGRLDAQRARAAALNTVEAVAREAQRAVQNASVNAQALMREIAGQGPEKTLHRGFAVVRSVDGATIASASAAAPGETVHVQFHDGAVAARIEQGQSSYGDQDIS